MGYWTYYLVLLFISFALARPAVMLGVIVFVLLRPWLPDPVVVMRTWGRIRALDRQIAANPANVPARRDLAMIWLDRLRPGRALELLLEAEKRDPDSAEIQYLIGLARYRKGDLDTALAPLVRAVDIDPRLRFGEPYLVAAEVLIRLKRHEEAEDAVERYIRINSSSVKAYYLLGLARVESGDKKGAHEAAREARSTFWILPWYRKRQEIGWWLRSMIAVILW